MHINLHAYHTRLHTSGVPRKHGIGRFCIYKLPYKCVVIPFVFCCTGGRVVASPYARKLASNAGVSLAGVSGTGPNGRIVADDVRQVISSGGAAAPATAGADGAPAPEGGYTDVQVGSSC